MAAVARNPRRDFSARHSFRHTTTALKFMANNPLDKPLESLEHLLDSTQQNLAGTALTGATKQMVESYPTPGSTESAAKHSNQIQCGQCHALNVSTANFCRNCGSPLAKITECPGCKAPVRANDKFCSQCGKPLTN
jgi:predicted amidophosphoribosyltransferase